MKLINENDIESAIDLIDINLEVKIKNWFVIHAQNSGEQRFRNLGHKKESKVDFEVDPVRSVSRFEAEVYARDNLRCRYCQNKLLPLNSLKIIERALGKDIFNVSGNTNQLRHGYVYVVRATADHVVPHNRGGRTNLENLVTSCWACNYGKGGYTLEEIGLDDPRISDVT